ncbi:MAG: histidine phosphatase family protein [Ilumatobacteraceae bacterium]
MTVVLVRHGETSWSRQRRHTGRSDIPLDREGRRRATALAPFLQTVPPAALILTSPLQRAVQTAALAGHGARAEACDDLLEWDYGDYEGRRTSDIREEIPGWSVWTHPIVGGESVEQVGVRADRVIARVVAHGGLAVLFAHAHVLRILGARWCGWPPGHGASLTLEPASISVLGHEREVRVIVHWDVVQFDLLAAELGR